MKFNMTLENLVIYLAKEVKNALYWNGMGIFFDIIKALHRRSGTNDS